MRFVAALQLLVAEALLNMEHLERFKLLNRRYKCCITVTPQQKSYRYSQICYKQLIQSVNSATGYPKYCVVNINSLKQICT